MLALFRVLFSPPMISLELSANVLEMRCQNTQALSWISLKGMREHSDFIHASAPWHLPPPWMYVDMIFTGNSQKTEITKAPSPEHSGYGEEVMKSPSACNQSFSLVIQWDKTPFSFFNNHKTKNIFSLFDC